MIIKKLLFVNILLLFMSLIFAQTTEYQEHFSKAKEYEASKQWIYALGEYYDAYNANSEQNEAKDSFNRLLNVITEGNPGYGEYDVFELYDNWILLLKNYEKYWTEYCPFIIKCSPLTRERINPETRTATYLYNLSMSLSDNEKYNIIKNAIKTGLKEVYETQKWDNIDLWHFCNNSESTRSVYNIEKDLNNYLKNLTAIFKYYYDDKILLSSTTTFVYFKEPYEGAKVRDVCEYSTSLFDIKLKIIDNEGNEIAKLDRQLVNNIEKEIVFPAEIIKIIDNGNYRIVPTEMFLYYGDPETNPGLRYDYTGERDFLKKLSNIKIDLSKVTFLDAYEQKENEKKEAERKQIEKEKEAELKKLDKEVRYALNQINSLIYDFNYLSAIEIKKDRKIKFFDNYMVNDAIDKMEILSKKYGVEKVRNVFIYIACNEFNKKIGLEIYYKINESKSNAFDNDFEFFLANYDNIEYNLSSNGWHLPSEEEKEIILKGSENPMLYPDLRSKEDIQNGLNGLFIIRNIN